MTPLNLWSTSCCVCLLLCCVQPFTISDSGDIILNKSDQNMLDMIHVCYRDDPRLNECLQKTFYGIRNRAVEGIPEMDFPPLEQLYKDEIEAFNVAGFRLKVKDIFIKGMSQLRILNSSASLESHEFVFHFLTETTDILANYELTGSILRFPVQSIGTISVTGKKLAATLRAKTAIIKKDGIEFFSLKDVNVQLKVEDGWLWISNLGFFEVPINQLLNTRFNRRFIIDHVIPIIDSEMERLTWSFGNYVYNTLPLDVIFPKGTRPGANLSNR